MNHASLQKLVFLWLSRQATDAAARSNGSHAAGSPPDSLDSGMAGSSTCSSESYSQSEEDDAELEQYQEALHNLEQQRDAVRI